MRGSTRRAAKLRGSPRPLRRPAAFRPHGQRGPRRQTPAPESGPGNPAAGRGPAGNRAGQVRVPVSHPERVLAPRRPRRADRGSVSLWLVIFAFVTFSLLVLVVDGGQTMNAKSRAADIAEQAARAAADDLNVSDLRGGAVALAGGAGGACDLRTGPAAQLVADYAAGVPGASAALTGCSSAVTDVGGTPSLTVTATVRLSVRSALPVPPFNTISATATETAYLACGSANQREAC